jgi:FdhD protein
VLASLSLIMHPSLSHSLPHQQASHGASAQSAQPRPVIRVAASSGESVDDVVAVEEPLEIRILSAGQERRVTVTMRTPGNDAELAIGFLSAERIVATAGEIIAVRPCETQPNLLRVELMDHCAGRLDNIARQFVATSSCGLCGKTSLEAVMGALPDAIAVDVSAPIASEVLRQIPARLRDAQAVFDRTGGLHAVAALSPNGELLSLYEDVGRHNAFDKLVGAMILAGQPDLGGRIVALSGRAGFELVQKAAVARAPVVAAIGAPSSLAVELAQRVGITLIGFLRATGFNVYTHPQRLALAQAQGALEGFR